MVPLTRLEHDFVRFRREVRILLALGFTFVLVSVIVLYLNASGQRNDIKETALESHLADCAFRADVRQRISSTRAFLVRHPDGIPPSVSRQDLEISIANLERTAKSFRFLTGCPPPPRPAPKPPIPPPTT